MYGVAVGIIFVLSVFYVWMRKRDDVTFGDWCAIVLFWLIVSVLLKIVGFGN